MLRVAVTSLSDPTMTRFLEKNKRMVEARKRLEDDIAEINNIIDNLDPVKNMREIEILKFRIREREKFIRDVYKVSDRLSSNKPVFVPRRRR